MNILNRLYSWYGKRVVLITAGIIVVLLVAGILVTFVLNTNQEEATTDKDLPLVTLKSISELNGEGTFQVTGEVRAVSEARLQTESGGRVTSVTVGLGDTVRAGSILATLENSAQRAALLQAEGAYEAALASGASSQSSIESAQTSLSASLSAAVNSYKSAYITVDNVVHATIDDLFSNPDSITPGFVLNGYGNAVSYNNERVALNGPLSQWNTDVSTTNANNIETRLQTAMTRAERVAIFTESLSAIVSRQDTTAAFTQEQKDSLQAEFLAARSSLNQTIQALEGAQTSIESARESLQRAQIAGNSGTASISDAQIKSALGTLRAAQSSYEKTIVRSPISGVVNAMYLNVGDYVSPTQPAATIANNDALEITAYVTESESTRLSLGDTVRINSDVQGTITQVAPAVDPVTGKVEVRIGTEGDALTNGQTVTIAFTNTTQTSNNDAIVIPITALKVETDRIVVFTVSDTGVLIAHPVTEGPLLGDSIVIVDGITKDMRIVLDARGLNEGDLVEVAA